MRYGVNRQLIGEKRTAVRTHPGDADTESPLKRCKLVAWLSLRHRDGMIAIVERKLFVFDPKNAIFEAAGGSLTARRWPSSDITIMRCVKLRFERLSLGIQCVVRLMDEAMIVSARCSCGLPTLSLATTQQRSMRLSGSSPQKPKRWIKTKQIALRLTWSAFRVAIKVDDALNCCNLRARRSLLVSESKTCLMFDNWHKELAELRQKNERTKPKSFLSPSCGLITENNWLVLNKSSRFTCDCEWWRGSI